MEYRHGGERRRTTLLLDQDLVKEAKRSDINISDFIENSLRDYLYGAGPRQTAKILAAEQMRKEAEAEKLLFEANTLGKKIKSLNQFSDAADDREKVELAQTVSILRRLKNNISERERVARNRAKVIHHDKYEWFELVQMI